MDKAQAQRIAQTPSYQKLVTTRSRFAWIMTSLMLLAYFSFLFLVAFRKDLLAQPLTETSITTWSIPVGIGLILFTIIITGIYVRRANGEFDTLTRQIEKEAGR